MQSLEIPDKGLIVYLKEFGWAKVFCENFKDKAQYYILYLPDLDKLKQLPRQGFRRIHDAQWLITSFHRFIKQVCNIERFYVRNGQVIRNHIFCAFSRLQIILINGLLDNLYQVSRQLFIPVIQQFILEHHIPVAS